MRKHADRIILLAEMMQASGSPCFKAGGAKTVAALRKRFHMGHTEAQVCRPSPPACLMHLASSCDRQLCARNGMREMLTYKVLINL